MSDRRRARRRPRADRVLGGLSSVFHSLSTGQQLEVMHRVQMGENLAQAIEEVRTDAGEREGS